MLLLAAASLTAQAPEVHYPFLSPIFGDHMVLQRDKPNTFWGWTTADQRVTVRIGNARASAKADDKGEWQVKLKPPKGPGPYDVMIDGPEHAELHDVLVGDVWLCTGQSNMEFGLTMASNADQALKNANHPDIRLYLQPHNYSFSPAELPNGTWKVCSPRTVAEEGWGGFSAVGYFFGLKLDQELHVPIGLIEDCWGGTVAEAWTSKDALKTMPAFDSDLKAIEDARRAQQSPASSRFDLWLEEKDPGTTARPEWSWPRYDDSAWNAIRLPGKFDGLAGGDKPSLVWIRKEIDLPYGQDPESAELDLGPIEAIDDTYVNGTRVGGQEWGPWYRKYGIPSGVLQQGPNTIAVRVVAPRGGAYVGAEGADFTLKVGGQSYPLAGKWKAKFGIDLTQPGAGPESFAGYPDLPTVLYNGMLYPVAPLALRGAIWYQGESNADRAYQYRKLLPLMIGDWRRTFRQGDFPFYIVSLASFMQRQTEPHDDSWAELREAQAMTAKKVPNSGLAVTIDVGNAEDIHPKDKETVGDRLAYVALAKTYHEKIPYSGPVFNHLVIRGSELRLEFSHIDGGLEFKGDPSEAFALAGADHKWYWADARIEGNSVVLSSPEVPRPVAARYAWQANPPAPLYNGAGLPAVPFRTDDWPGATSAR